MIGHNRTWDIKLLYLAPISLALFEVFLGQEIIVPLCHLKIIWAIGIIRSISVVDQTTGK